MQKPSLGYLHVVANWVLEDSHGGCCVPTWKLVTASIYRCTVLVTRNFTKSDEIRGNSARIPQSFCAAIRGMILRYPRNDTSLSAE